MLDRFIAKNYKSIQIHDITKAPLPKKYKCITAIGVLTVGHVDASASKNWNKLTNSMLKSNANSENWEKFTGVNGVSKAQWLNAPYGLKRFKGLIQFMNSEDWSARLPETREYLTLVNKKRGWDKKFLKVFPLFDEVMNGDIK